MDDAGVDGRALPPAEALRAPAAQQPHPPQAARRRRARRPHRRRRHRRGVDGRRPGPRPLARHPRPRARPGRARPAGRLRRELARGDRRGARRRRTTCPSSSPSDGGGADAVDPLDAPAWATRTSRPSTSSRSPPRGSRIDLTSAYFAPRPAFIEALSDAADRGVAVRVLVPGEHIDKDFVRTAGRATYGELLRCGVRICEYGPTMLHAKALVVDGAWSAVGSVNFDNRSFQLNDEAVALRAEPDVRGRARRAVRARPRGVARRSTRRGGRSAGS